MIGETWWLLLILLLVLSVAMRYDILLFLTVLLTLGSVASLLSFRYCLHGVIYRRKFKDDHILCDQETDLTIEVTNAKPLPLAWLLVRDTFPAGLSLIVNDAGGDQEIETAPPYLKDMLVLRWYESVQRSYRVRGTRRGVYTFGSASITSGNLFGLERKRMTIDRPDRLGG